MTRQTVPTLNAIPTSDPPDFSLVLGGPLFQLYRKAHLSGAALELLKRRVVVIALIAWLPLFFLSIVEGHALGAGLKIPFLHDIEAHARFLIALPMLIIAELVVHRRISPVVTWFIERRIVPSEELQRFKAAIGSALRFRNSVVMELILLGLVYTVGLWTWRSQVAMEGSTWYSTPDDAKLHLTLAGYWYVFVSIPLFQFLLVRWYMRLVLWYRLLWQVSRLNLHLTAAHPDQMGGIGFLGKATFAFAPILFAQGALLAGVIASRILYDGRNLMSYKTDVCGLVILLVLFVIAPLVMFSPLLERTQREGAIEYGLLANRYMFGFEKRWIQGGAPEVNQLLGTSDIQSLADMGNSYSAIRQMKMIPFEIQDVTLLVAAAVAPMLPLLLTVFSLQELLTRLIKLLF